MWRRWTARVAVRGDIRHKPIQTGNSVELLTHPGISDLLIEGNSLPAVYSNHQTFVAA
jgi:hypothetical protein